MARDSRSVEVRPGRRLHRFESLRAKLRAAVDALDRGDFVDLTDDALDAFFDSLGSLANG